MAGGTACHPLGCAAKGAQGSREPSHSEISSPVLGFSLHSFCSSHADSSPVHRGFQFVVHGLCLLGVRETPPIVAQLRLLLLLSCKGTFISLGTQAGPELSWIKGR